LSVCRAPPGTATPDVGATSLHTLVQMVAGGLGVTLLPRLAADAGVAGSAPVALRPFAEPIYGRSIGVAWRDGSTRAEEAQMLAALFKAELFERSSSPA
jgi:LysR family hydrogen peroxide-inducible transcriptional activator